MANPVKAAFKFGRGTVTRTVDGNTVSRARTGGYVLRPKSTVHTKDGGGRNVSRTVIGGGMTRAGENTVALAVGAGGTAAAIGHRKHYTPRKQTRTVRVKVRKNQENTVTVSAFGVEHAEVSKAFGFGSAAKLTGGVKPMLTNAKLGAKPLKLRSLNQRAAAMGASAGAGARKATMAAGTRAKNAFGGLSTTQKVGVGVAGAGVTGGAGFGMAHRNRTR